ncbi:MAG TPA: histidine kinase [Candidatus Fusicatenibacter intestinigallinarum]|uniref:Histidine kinase n=1 Tax=Candidatus Fusicatenibacter intestinigallinarum TaxID=2838598 RepID=A0A9D2SNE6_9FIRM|nr:histidine kinase [Candidatus Fusicatenibacter intestinigallinarum]
MGRRKEILKRMDSFLQTRLEKLNLKRKMLVLYLGCVLMPLVITDTFVFGIVIRSEQGNERHKMQNVVSAVKYSLKTETERAAALAKSIYLNRYINEFLTRTYDSDLEFYNAYLEFMKDTLFESSLGSEQMKVVMYSDNPTIVSGSEFQKLERVEDTEWYQEFRDSGQEMMMYCYYDTSGLLEATPSRKISLIRKLNLYQRDSCEKVLKIDLDYSGLTRNLVNMNYEFPIYVCENGSVLLSNKSDQGVLKPFEPFVYRQLTEYTYDFQIYGQELEVCVLRVNNGLVEYIQRNLPLLFLLVCINILLPWILVRNINRSLTYRIQRLGEVFAKGCESEELSMVEDATGNDEISVLMRNYNWMAARQNELVQTVYKEKLKERETDIARQNAELLALHSQINPHFLFNALESIRMHSFLKKEYETAHMVEMLAVMERQNVDWGNDDVTVREEVGFVQAYLELQKYRFGDRMSFRIEVEDSCRMYLIPKLSLVTFVENACVHGIESKPAPGWVFVRVFLHQGDLCLEVEDTGVGIAEEMLEQMRKAVEDLSIEKILQMEHIGISNACLRLKMKSQNTARFLFESEQGVGSCVTVRIPVEKLKKLERSGKKST